ncbi:MAG: endonuclease Q family protein, partial [Candidatus Micrarchaeaceae archaeon]
MKVIADLHIHSRFSRACSNKINPVSLEKAAKLKGINLISTGDFLHKDWLLELKQNLVKDNESGFYKIKNSNENIKFVLGTEISTFFWEKSKSKRIHTCVLIKNIESIEQIRDQLSKFGHIDADGRPILSISTSELMDILLNIEKNAFIFPAHIWTPFFGALGDMSGFNSIKEAYQDQEKHIYALETGLSSDPIMNWRVSQLDKYALISNSDAHSLDKIGREANVFNVENFSYDNVINAIKEKNIKKFEKTIEFYPEEGKYHFDGHRQCNFSLDPQNENNEICPICKKQLVIGVLHRVNELADRPVGFIPKNSIPYEHQIPLKEIISIVIKKGVNTQGVEKKYNALIQEFGTEFNALNSSFDAISKIDQNI